MKIRDARGERDAEVIDVESVDETSDADAEPVEERRTRRRGRRAKAETADQPIDDPAPVEAEAAEAAEPIEDVPPADAEPDVPDIEAVEHVEPVEEVEPIEAVEAEPVETLEEPEPSVDLTDEPATAEQPALVPEAAGDVQTVPPPPSVGFDGESALLADTDRLREQWDRIQLGFVDEPLDAVEGAGRFVSEVLDELARTFAARREEIEGRWRAGGEVSTEDLRLVFRGYRAFFNRIIR